MSKLAPGPARRAESPLRVGTSTRGQFRIFEAMMLLAVASLFGLALFSAMLMELGRR